jgi:hypothetical protein
LAIHWIRHIRTCNFLGNGQEEVAVATASSGLSGRLSLLLVNPVDLKVRWMQENLGTFANDSGRRFFSMLILDLDGVTCRDILSRDYSAANRSKQREQRDGRGRRQGFRHASNRHRTVTSLRPLRAPISRRQSFLSSLLSPVPSASLRLSGENLSLVEGQVRLQIPAGTLRMVDIEHR